MTTCCGFSCVVVGFTPEQLRVSIGWARPTVGGPELAAGGGRGAADPFIPRPTLPPPWQQTPPPPCPPPPQDCRSHPYGEAVTIDPTASTTAAAAAVVAAASKSVGAAVLAARQVAQAPRRNAHCLGLGAVGQTEPRGESHPIADPHLPPMTRRPLPPAPTASTSHRTATAAEVAEGVPTSAPPTGCVCPSDSNRQAAAVEVAATHGPRVGTPAAAGGGASGAGNHDRRRCRSRRPHAADPVAEDAATTSAAVRRGGSGSRGNDSGSRGDGCAPPPPPPGTATAAPDSGGSTAGGKTRWRRDSQKGGGRPVV